MKTWLASPIELGRTSLFGSSWVRQLERLCWIDGRNGMLVDELRAVASDKLNREVIETLNPANSLIPFTRNIMPSILLSRR
jgi:hypothetical protein